jgi:cytochrome c heme-lyase
MWTRCCCVLPIGVFLNILDDCDVDGGESARAVDLFGWHGYGCVNVVELLIWTRGSKRTREIPRGSTRSTFGSCRVAAAGPYLTQTLFLHLPFLLTQLHLSPSISSSSESTSPPLQQPHTVMRTADMDPEAKCPVDDKTRQKWLEAAKAKTQSQQQQHQPQPPTQTPPPRMRLRLPPTARYSLDSGLWVLPDSPASPASQPPPSLSALDSQREISSIPRSLQTGQGKALNAAERAALPSNAEKDTGHDEASGNWIYPSQEMFFNAMKRKGHEAQAQDMSSVVPIHNAVNERAWAEIKKWEEGQGSEACGGPKLVSFAGDSKALTPKARWNNFIGYALPFDRHDWVVDRCGTHVDYVIDFYSGKGEGLMGKGLNFYLDVRPKLNSWEGVKLRASKIFGM